MDKEIIKLIRDKILIEKMNLDDSIEYILSLKEPKKV